ncbi:MAG TPA: hypothetical protein DCW90_02045 [Lachnospiraceae bacterium]|nr:hypothetical protein [Lachnospiraceae bacterium]
MKKLLISIVAIVILGIVPMTAFTGCGETDVVKDGLAGTVWSMDEFFSDSQDFINRDMAERSGILDMFYLYFKDDTTAMFVGEERDYQQFGDKFSMYNNSISGEINGDTITLNMGIATAKFVRNTSQNAFIPNSINNTVWLASRWGTTTQDYKADSSTKDYIVFKDGYATTVKKFGKSQKSYTYKDGVITTDDTTTTILGNKMLGKKKGYDYIVYEKCTDQNKANSLINTVNSQNTTSEQPTTNRSYTTGGKTSTTSDTLEYTLWDITYLSNGSGDVIAPAKKIYGSNYKAYAIFAEQELTLYIGESGNVESINFGRYLYRNGKLYITGIYTNVMGNSIYLEMDDIQIVLQRR